MVHLPLALSCIALLCVIAAQDWLCPPLRNQTISAGLTGPYHTLLDAAYMPVAASLCVSFHGHLVMEVFAIVAAVFLILVAVTNTAHVFVDKLTGGHHALWHSRCTIVVFAAALLLELAGDHGWRWGLTVANVVLPTICYTFFHYKITTIKGVTVTASPAAEKLAVLGLCIWLIACNVP